jgi:hypothetical protein
LTAGIQKNISWWTPDVLATHSGALWELDPVEVVSRPVPPPRVSSLPAIEAAVFADEGVDVATFKAYLKDNNLALIVSRDVTQRDRADRHQPFNLQVPGGVASIATGGAVYDVAYLQVFQGDALRGYGDLASPYPGRRLLARPMHEAGVSQAPGAPAGAVQVASDGSIAAFVPARRALAWQLTDTYGSGVVRERNWISFQAGEIRVCGNCHGVNKFSQTGQPPPVNEPQALHDLLEEWKLSNGALPTVTPVPTPSPTPMMNAACGNGLVMDDARLRARFSAGTLGLRGSAVIPLPWIGVAPAVNGIRVTLSGGIDAVVPGGPGWTVGSSGKRWRYVDPAGTHGGIRRIDVMDRSLRVPGELAIRVRLVAPGSLPAIGPVDASVRFGTAGECAVAHWNGPAGPPPLCQGSGLMMSCL